MRTLVMWDIDGTLLRGGGVALRAWRTAFDEVVGHAWRQPDFGGRTDLDIYHEVAAGAAHCTPDEFFERYVAEVTVNRHEFAEQGWLMPGVREVLARLADRPDVVQTLVTGNHRAVATLKVAAFDLEHVFDADVGGYGTDDSVRATLVRRSLERASAKYGERFRGVVVGDTGNDVAAALANDVSVVAVATGGVSAEELGRAGAHHVLPDLSDVDASVATIAMIT